MKAFCFFLFFSLLVGWNCSSTADPLEEVDWLEIFYAFEIQEFPSQINMQSPASYTDFLIQKYELWEPLHLDRLLSLFEDQKQKLFVQREAWEKFLLQAQNYEIPSSWKKELQDMEANKKETFLKFLEKDHPKWIEGLENLKSLEEGTLSESPFPLEGLTLSEENPHRILMRYFFLEAWKNKTNKLN